MYLPGILKDTYERPTLNFVARDGVAFQRGSRSWLRTPPLPAPNPTLDNASWLGGRELHQGSSEEGSQWKGSRKGLSRCSKVIISTRLMQGLPALTGRLESPMTYRETKGPKSYTYHGLLELNLQVAGPSEPHLLSRQHLKTQHI